jgi:hypothetical protein
MGQYCLPRVNIVYLHDATLRGALLFQCVKLFYALLKQWNSEKFEGSGPLKII